MKTQGVDPKLMVANLQYVIQDIAQDLQQGSAETQSTKLQREMKLVTQLLGGGPEETPSSAAAGRRKTVEANGGWGNNPAK